MEKSAERQITSRRSYFNFFEGFDCNSTFVRFFFSFTLYLKQSLKLKFGAEP